MVLNRKTLASAIAFLIFISFLPVSCAAAEPEIPPEYVTHTREGLYSLSYPAGWVLDEGIDRHASSERLESLEDAADPEGLTETLFIGGMLGELDYNPLVAVYAAPRHEGNHTLREIYEADRDYFLHTFRDYHENSSNWTTVDGRPAVILDISDTRPEYGRIRYLKLITVSGGLAWYVTCVTSDTGFDAWTATFESVARSLRVLR